MGRVENMLRRGWVPLLASILVFQTNCLQQKKSVSSSVFIHDLSHLEMTPVTKVRESDGLLQSPVGLEKLEAKFLNLLGMKERPRRNVARGDSKNKRIVRELMSLYEKQRESEFETTDLFLPGKLTRHANTVRTLHPESIEASRSVDKFTLKFDLSPIPPNEVVTGAELRVPFSVTIPPPPNQSSSLDSSILIRVLLHDVVKPANSKRPDVISYVTDSKLVNLTNRKYPTFWLTFDLLPAVLRWINGSRNHGVSLHLMGFAGQDLTSVQGAAQYNLKVKVATEENSASSSSPAVLFLYTDDGHNKQRRKREAMTKKSSSTRRKHRSPGHGHHSYRNYHGGGKRRKHRYKNRRRNLCSRKAMFVDFTDVGWNDWIVAPPGYQAFYCSGECPFPMGEHLNATNHAVIQALLNSMNPMFVPPPCCVPRKYSSLSLLYTDSSDRIVLKNYNEMVVDSCGCS